MRHGAAFIRRTRLGPVIGIAALLIAMPYVPAEANAANDGLGLDAATSADLSRQSVARASVVRSYDDGIDDVVSAPDICASSFITNDNLVLTIGLHIDDRTSFSWGDMYSIYLDTDSNTATGTDALSGAPPGADYAIDVARGKTWLLRWNGSAFDPVTPQIPIATMWLDGFGPTLRIGREDLGDPRFVRFVFVTTNSDQDLAPDTGMWSYQLSPLTLTPGQLDVTPARAGKRLVASMSVERGDFEIPLDQGTVRCAARVGGKTLAGRGAFGRQRVICRWRLPRSSTGKWLAGSVQVTFEGVSARRVFNIRVS
jgi:hypothetical protein